MPSVTVSPELAVLPSTFATCQMATSRTVCKPPAAPKMSSSEPSNRFRVSVALAANWRT